MRAGAAARLLPRAILVALLGALPSKALAAVVEQSLVFIGEQHARVLLVTDGPVEDVQTSSIPAIGDAPARVRLMLEGATLSSALESAYQRRPGGTEMRVGHKGVRSLVFAQVGSHLQVGVELDTPRTASVQALGKRALLLDLRSPQAPPDTTLPEPEYLLAWMNGLSVPRDEAKAPRQTPRIVLDPGHGGEDPGAVGTTGTREADVALSLARRLARALETELDAEVVLTRDDDTFISLPERALMANGLDADLFISIHANAAPSSTLWGVETYYLDVATDEAAARVARRENKGLDTSDPASRVVSDLVISGTSALSRRLATEIQGAVVERMKVTYGEEHVRDLGVKSAMFYVLVSARMPSILFEASFVSNPGDEMRLRTPAFQRECADSMVAGIKRYLDEVAW